MESTALEARRFGSLYLPLARSNEGLADDLAYIESAKEQVGDLARYCSMGESISILDFGCGQGRFANGLLATGQVVGAYLGVDTSLQAVNWCKQWILPGNHRFDFKHVPSFNARYNPKAEPQQELPLPVGSFDVAFLNSVFSHMLDDDVAFYLGQLGRSLKIGGIVYMTAFLEPNVADVEENPKGYLGKESIGPLHRVRFEESYFLDLVSKAGFRIVDYRHQGVGRTGQSVVVAEKLG